MANRVYSHELWTFINFTIDFLEEKVFRTFILQLNIYQKQNSIAHYKKATKRPSPNFGRVQT
jgi:hypothetical protein